MNQEKSLKRVFKILYPVLAVLICMVSCAVIFDTFNLTIPNAAYNIVLFMPLFGLFLMITRRFPAAVMLTVLLAFILFYIDQYVFSTRLTHIRITDWRLISQAVRVANRYRPIWNAEMTRRLMICLGLSAFLFFIYRYYHITYDKKLLFFLGLAEFAITTGIILSGVIPSGAEGFDFTYNTEDRGLLYSWYCQMHAAKLTEPDGYSREAATTLLSKYDETEPTDDVRVIVIMNESLADYSLLGNTRFEDPLPFLHNLVESGEAFEGKLSVSVFGGGTANTEYEFLTGCSCAFLPDGATPYLQYVDHDLESIVSDLGDKSKIAVHPYYAEEWNRTQVYRFFGFDRFISGADFGSTVISDGQSATRQLSDTFMSFGDGPLYIRGLISDQTCYERIQQENADFTFAVTMQNHGSYVYNGDDFVNTAYVTEENRLEWDGKHNLIGMTYDINPKSLNEELFKVNQYLTCVKLSDQAFESLITDLEKSEQKTIVLLFGDHQPGVLISEHYVDCEESVDMDYIVPYILWANYDIEFDAPAYTSPNYLSAILKKNAGMGLTAWDQFRLDMMQEYPVVTANYILDKDGNTVGRDNLKDYEIVQYMRMFD